MIRRSIGLWMGAAFSVAFALGMIVIAIAGANEKGIVIALRVTARLSYALFWPAYAASAMALLFGPDFKVLARHGREFGLAFASAHLVHVGLVVWLYRISARPPVSEAAFIFFGVGILWTYLLVLFSIERLSRALGPRGWRIVRTIGLEYIALAFALDFILPLRGGVGVKQLVAYVPFAAFAVAGWILRLGALILAHSGTKTATS